MNNSASPQPIWSSGETADDVVRASGLVKRFREKVAVAHVDLFVRAGERVALLGPNGAGKTTTLLMLLGAITPDEGSVELVGHALPHGRRRALESVGFAAGYLPLPERMRVREYLRYYAQLYGLADPAAVVGRGLERFGISHLAGRLGTELSSGQRTLVGIVKATLHEPRLLVLDEPTASLDPDVAHDVRLGLLDICETLGTAILLTSHDMVEVERLSERIVFVAQGRVVADGSPAKVMERFGHGALEDVFLQLARDSRAAAPFRSQEADRSSL